MASPEATAGPLCTRIPNVPPPTPIRPPGKLQAQLPSPISQPRTIYKRKDSTSQSSPGSMATTASGVSLPPASLRGPRGSREMWAGPPVRGGVKRLSCGPAWVGYGFSPRKLREK